MKKTEESQVLILVGEIKGITVKNSEQIDALSGKVDEVKNAFSTLPCDVNSKRLGDLEEWKGTHNSVVKDKVSEKVRGRTNLRIGFILAGFGLLCSAIGIGFAELVAWLKAVGS